jgi:hypothetical protein
MSGELRSQRRFCSADQPTLIPSELARISA